MKLKRFATTTLLAMIAASVPISGGANTSTGLGLSAASCEEGSCGMVSKGDCICPDQTEKNREPRCFD